MLCMVAMAMTTTDTDCVWSFLAAGEAPEEVLEGLVEEVVAEEAVELQEADMDLHPGALNTESLCLVFHKVAAGRI